MYPEDHGAVAFWGGKPKVQYIPVAWADTPRKHGHDPGPSLEDVGPTLYKCYTNVLFIM